MTRTGLMLWVSISMTFSITYGQSLLSARSMSLGAYGASVNDSRSFQSNPAGIVGMRDWEVTSSTYTGTSNAGFVFQNLTIGKRFFDSEALAIAYTPGLLLEFALPSIITTGDSGSIQQKISYHESFSFAYAHRFSGEFSLGVLGRLVQENVNDTKYELVQQGLIITPRSNEAMSMAFDMGFLWNVSPSVGFGLVGRNLLVAEGKLPDEVQDFGLPFKRSLEFSTRWRLGQSSLVASVSTLRSGSLGMEVEPGKKFAFRGSLFFNKDESPKIFALAVGAGWGYQFLEADVAYIRFFGNGSHSGTGSVESFDVSTISALDLTRYTPDRVVLSVKAIFGNVRQSLARIEAVEMLSGVYPSSYELFAFRPIGRVKVRNTSDKPIQAKASFFVEKYMDAPTESPSVYLLPGEEKEIPFNAVLNDQVRQVNKLTIREGNIYVSATPAEDYDDRFQTKILIHGRNDWDGDVHSLRHFVTPDDPEILRYTRDILLHYKDSLSAVARELEQLVKARLLFNAFAGKLVYVSDPKQSSDYVQYPSETLTLKSGDCDDMTACFSSLLSSVGISTAFVDVVPPEAPEKSHIYMLFDSGLDPKYGNKVSENPKRYMVRKNASGQETIWLPIETTVITKGFDAAWSTGASEYFEDVELNLGLVKGWVRIVDVN